MLASLIPSGIWTMLLVLGIAASFITVVMIVGTAPTKRNAISELPPGSLAKAVRENASARAAAAVRNRPGHQLTNVRALDATAIEGHLASDPAGGPAGQTPARANDEVSSGDGSAEAEAIVRHFAVHDPKRIAEVITAWIRADTNNAKRSGR
jgi:hypothetical protein